jgi:hypothetical protein
VYALRRLPIVMAAMLAVACTPKLSDQPTAAEILAQSDHWYVGPQGLANALGENETLRNHVLSNICSGSGEWLLVAQKVFPSNYAHLNEELSSALAVALVAAPDQVLRHFGTGVCHMPDYLPASCETASWSDRVHSALAGSTAGPEAQSRVDCLAMLRAGNVP